jgi:hypothetical protein
MSAESAPLRLREEELRTIARFARCASWLKNRVLLRSKRRSCDVLRRLDRQAQKLGTSKEDLFLGSHRRGLNRQRALDPFVIGNELAVGEREQVIYVICIPVGGFVIEKGARHGARRVPLIVIGRSAHSRNLKDEAALRKLANPFRFGSIGRPKSKISVERVIGVAFEVIPVCLRMREARACFQQHHVETTRCELLRDDRPSSSCPRNDDVAHSVLSRRSRL